MKISTFSNMFKVEQYTLRYYVKLGLLVPEIKNRQYFFISSCVSDMHMILHLKEANYSLKEIHEILSLYRISNLATKEDVDKLLSYYIKKREQLNRELEGIDLKLQEIHNMSDDLRVPDDKEGDGYENT